MMTEGTCSGSQLSSETNWRTDHISVYQQGLKAYRAVLVIVYAVISLLSCRSIINSSRIMHRTSLNSNNDECLNRK